MAAAEEVISVRIESRNTVLPWERSSHEEGSTTLFLSCLDLVWQDMHYNRRLLFYDATENADPAAMVELLRRSLSHALVLYYPWAGRLLRPPSATRTAIICNDAGVEFVSASSTQPLSSLRPHAFQIRPIFQLLCPDLILHASSTADDLPLLSVQVTAFSDGGLALGVCHSHVVADGQALWNFMVHWAACARHLLHHNTAVMADLLDQPCNDRELLALPNPSPALAKTNFVNFDMTEPDPTAAVDGIRENGDGGGAHGEANGKTVNDSAVNHVTEDGEEAQLVQCVLELPPEAVVALKKEAGGSYTSYEAMCAHFWQRVAVARSPEGEIDGQLTTFAVMANVRSRVKPKPLPSAYFGNAVMFGEVGATVGELRRETLEQVAARIHEAVENATRLDAVAGFMHWLELHDCRAFPRFQPAGVGVAANMSVASSPRFPAYAVDFGWGRPVAVRAVKCGAGEMVLFGGRPGAEDMVEICVALPAAALGRLLHDDPAFLAKLPPASGN